MKLEMVDDVVEERRWLEKPPLMNVEGNKFGQNLSILLLKVLFWRNKKKNEVLKAVNKMRFKYYIYIVW